MTVFAWLFCLVFKQSVAPALAVKVTPDIKRPGNSSLVHVDLGRGRRRLGGSALAHVFAQVGARLAASLF